MAKIWHGFYLFRRQIHDTIAFGISHILVAPEEDTLEDNLDNFDCFRVARKER
jgi:hypothetical protein